MTTKFPGEDLFVNHWMRIAVWARTGSDLISALHLNFYEVVVKLEATDKISQGVLEKLALDFDFFCWKNGAAKANDVNAANKINEASETNEEGDTPFAVFELRGLPAPLQLKPNSMRLFKTKMCSVYGLGVTRVCQYGFQSVIWSRNLSRYRRLLVYSPDPEELYEISYTTLLSVVGEALDQKGYHRIHALGIENKGWAGLLILPSGGGKSTLALSLLNFSDIRLFSDETPLLKKDFIFPFPARISVDPEVIKKLGVYIDAPRFFKRRLYSTKQLVQIPAAKIAGPNRLSFILIGEKSASHAHISKTNCIQVFWSLFKTLVIGWGVAQMAEHMLRLNSLHRLLFNMVSRCRCCLLLLLNPNKYFFHMSSDVTENSKVLNSFFSERVT